MKIYNVVYENLYNHEIGAKACKTLKSAKQCAIGMAELIDDFHAKNDMIIDGNTYHDEYNDYFYIKIIEQYVI